jgi:hypothetical protein
MALFFQAKKISFGHDSSHWLSADGGLPDFVSDNSTSASAESGLPDFVIIRALLSC